MIILLAMNDIAYLVTEKPGEEDEEGFITETVTEEEEVFCKVASATRLEHYTAMRSGVDVSIVMTINADEYSRQKKVKFEGTLYDVKRVYQKSEGYIELSLAEVV